MITKLYERYNSRKLTYEDIIDNVDIFNNIDYEEYMNQDHKNNDFIKLKNYFDNDTFYKILKEHPKFIKNVINSGYLYVFENYLNNINNTEETFIEAAKNYFLQTFGNISNSNFRKATNGEVDWIESFHFKVSDELTSSEDLLNYNNETLILNSNEQALISSFGINNIKKINAETGIFSYKEYNYSNGLVLFEAIKSYLGMRFRRNYNLNFKNGTLSYDEFKDTFARLLDNMRSNNIFTDFPNYDFIKGPFREEHPELFISKDAPEELRDAFYRKNITPRLLAEHKEYIKYLLDKNLANTINIDLKLRIIGLRQDNGISIPADIDFTTEYTKRYGNLKYLKLISKYGDILNNMTISIFHDEIEDELAIEKSLRNAIYNMIIKSNINYSTLLTIPEFLSEHPELFINVNDLKDIASKDKTDILFAFYSRRLTYSMIKKYPELVDILKDKNLNVVFSNYNIKYMPKNSTRNSLALLNIFGNEKFLALCKKYGPYMDRHMEFIEKYIEFKDNKIYYKDSYKNELTIDDIDKLIEDTIYSIISLGHLEYNDINASFLKDKHPELFLSDNAPEDLKNAFYSNSFNFEMLSQNRNWLPYLNDVDINVALIRGNMHRISMDKYFKLFGYDKAIKFGINRSETVTEMINANKVELMYSWYQKTGCRFIPDVVIMQSFPLEEVDKFLTNGSIWSNLMKIKSFANDIDARSAMLKLAYSFGAFDNDNRGLKKLYDLLTGIPAHITSEYGRVIEDINKTINLYNHPEYVTGDYYNLNDQIIDELQNTLNKENIIANIRKNGFSEIYEKNKDGSYTLKINPQNAPKSCAIIRSILEKYSNFPIITPTIAHKLFGGFDLNYDPHFREFLLANLDNILENPDYATYLASIQKQFNDIRVINSNRILTIDLAVSYVQQNKYIGVNVGNEQVAEISSIAGYTQQDFNILQQIYNHGKQRTYSSIPRIEGTTDKYQYEILRLDDPLAMAIGTLTDCCQELGNEAEMCMEHSMTSTNGRVFVIRDNQGNIVSQSWMWRNKDTICFDNIEIPNKAFARAKVQKGEYVRSDFTDEVLDVYKKAAHALILRDEEVYKSLLSLGKISNEEYEGLRLGKVTVGLGYNDIAISIKTNTKKDDSLVARPLAYTPPVELAKGLYTKDSTTQYILEERKDRKTYNGDTLPVHEDEYKIYDDNNLTTKNLLSLEKLEAITNNTSYNLDTAVEEYAQEGAYVKEIADNLGLNKETTKIIIHANFSIIYDINKDKIRIGALLFNTTVDNKKEKVDITNKVVIQIRQALDQISNGNDIDISLLNDKQKEMYQKAMNLNEELDIERGVGHVR